MGAAITQMYQGGKVADRKAMTYFPQHSKPVSAAASSPAVMCALLSAGSGYIFRTYGSSGG